MRKNWSKVLCAAGLLYFVTGASAQVVTLPAGTVLEVALETRLSTKDSKTGDVFRANLVMPVFVEEQEVLPIGATVEGTVQRVQEPGRVSGRAELQLRPEKLLLPSGEELTLSAAVSAGQGDDRTKVVGEEGTIQASGKEGMNTRGVATAATTGTIMGAVIANSAGGSVGTGALIGAGAVGAVALIHQLFKRGRDAELPAGSELALQLNRPLSFNPTMQEVAPGEGGGEYSVPLRDRRPELTR